MSNVGSSTDTANYYRKLSDLEEELREDSKRSEQNRRDQVNELQSNFDRELLKKDEQTNRVVANVQDNADESNRRVREDARKDVDDSKRDMYDRFGKSLATEREDSDRKIKGISKYAEDTHVADQERNDRLEKAYQNKITQREGDNKARTEALVADIHENTGKKYEELAEQRKVSAQEQNVAAQKKYDDLVSKQNHELDFRRQQFERAYDDSQRDNKTQMESFQRATAAQQEKLNRKGNGLADEQVRTLNEAHAAEMRDYRDRLNESVGDDKKYTHDKSQGYADATREMEGKYRAREDSLADAFKLEGAHHEQTNKALADYYGRQNQSNLKNKDTYYTGLLTEQNQKANDSAKNSQKTFEQQVDQLKKSNDHDRDAMFATMDLQRERSGEERDKAMANQSENFTNAMRSKAQSDDLRIKSLEKSNNQLKTSEDPNVVSPSAEHAIRTNVIKEYEKAFTAEKNANQENLDSVKGNFSRKYHEAVEDHELDKSTSARDFMTQQQLDRQQFSAYTSDLEAQRDETQRSASYSMDKNASSLNRNYANSLERQRRQFDDQSSTFKNDADAKFQSMRQELQFQNRLQARDSAARENGLIRDYDKKLTDQKLDYEAQIEDLKAQSTGTLHESEKKLKADMDIQLKAADQKVAQTEQQSKERERVMERNYQDELDKVRRANAVLIQKKS